MKFTSSGLVKGGVFAVLAGALIVAALRFSGFAGGGDAGEDPAFLARAATDALEAVKRRQPGERRPASYDAVLAPLDKLLAQAKALLENDDYNPVGDFEALRSRVNPVIDIATRADAQARTETGPLAKEYRFNDQKGEACQYLATAIWERINARRPGASQPLDVQPSLPAPEVEEMRRIVDLGLAAAPGNRDLWYIRAVVNRAEGMFAPAARDLERAIAIHSEYVAAWNTLGLVRISLKEFELAENALERAKALSNEQANRLNLPLGEEYRAIVYNLASFHEGFAVYYNRENRVNPTVEARRLLARHAAAARQYFEEYLRLVGTDSPDAQNIRGRLNALPG